jgi:hypothetical protein
MKYFVLSGSIPGYFSKYFSTKENKQEVYIGLTTSILFISWVSLYLPGPGRFNDLCHRLMMVKYCHIVLFVGYIAFFLRAPMRTASLFMQEGWKERVYRGIVTPT